jgi:hypothetical protein
LTEQARYAHEVISVAITKQSTGFVLENQFTRINFVRVCSGEKAEKNKQLYDLQSVNRCN